MKKQDLDNMAALDIFDRAMDDYNNTDARELKYHHYIGKTMVVIETQNFYLLLSYSTLVAAIDKASGFCGDVLRHEWGKYSRTSNKHILLFTSDFGNPLKRYTYK